MAAFNAGAPKGIHREMRSVLAGVLEQPTRAFELGPEQINILRNAATTWTPTNFQFSNVMVPSETTIFLPVAYIHYQIILQYVALTATPISQTPILRSDMAYDTTVFQNPAPNYSDPDNFDTSGDGAWNAVTTADAYEAGVLEWTNPATRTGSTTINEIGGLARYYRAKVNDSHVNTFIRSNALHNMTNAAVLTLNGSGYTLNLRNLMPCLEWTAWTRYDTKWLLGGCVPCSPDFGLTYAGSCLTQPRRVGGAPVAGTVIPANVITAIGNSNRTDRAALGGIDWQGNTVPTVCTITPSGMSSIVKYQLDCHEQLLMPPFGRGSSRTLSGLARLRTIQLNLQFDPNPDRLLFQTTGILTAGGQVAGAGTVWYGAATQFVVSYTDFRPELNFWTYTPPTALLTKIPAAIFAPWTRADVFEDTVTQLKVAATPPILGADSVQDQPSTVIMSFTGNKSFGDDGRKMYQHTASSRQIPSVPDRVVIALRTRSEHAIPYLGNIGAVCQGINMTYLNSSNLFAQYKSFDLWTISRDNDGGQEWRDWCEAGSNVCLNPVQNMNLTADNYQGKQKNANMVMVTQWNLSSYYNSAAPAVASLPAAAPHGSGTQRTFTLDFSPGQEMVHRIITFVEGFTRITTSVVTYSETLAMPSEVLSSEISSDAFTKSTPQSAPSSGGSLFGKARSIFRRAVNHPVGRAVLEAGMGSLNKQLSGAGGLDGSSTGLLTGGDGAVASGGYDAKRPRLR